MSHFVCQHCGAHIVDSPIGYLSGCRHYPRETHQRKSDNDYCNAKLNNPGSGCDCDANDGGGMSNLCEICKTRKPVPKHKICWVCMGFPERQEEAVTQEPKTSVEPSMSVCTTCGDYIKPYQLGRSTVHRGSCYPCMMRKKYGPEWIPGGKKKTREQRNEFQRRYRAKKRAAIGKDNGGAMMDKPDTTVQVAAAEASELFDSKFPWVGQQLDQGVPCVSLCFDARDQAMYEKIADIARTERRTIEQQVLYLLDGVLSRTVA